MLLFVGMKGTKWANTSGASGGAQKFCFIVHLFFRLRKRQVIDHTNGQNTGVKPTHCEEPMKSEDVTDDQLSVLATVIKVGITPYRFWCVEAVRTTGSQELKIHIALFGPQWLLAYQRSSWPRFICNLGGLLESVQDCCYHV